MLSVVFRGYIRRSDEAPRRPYQLEGGWLRRGWLRRGWLRRGWLRRGWLRWSMMTAAVCRITTTTTTTNKRAGANIGPKVVAAFIRREHGRHHRHRRRRCTLARTRTLPTYSSRSRFLCCVHSPALSFSTVPFPTPSRHPLIHPPPVPSVVYSSSFGARAQRNGCEKSPPRSLPTTDRYFRIARERAPVRHRFLPPSVGIRRSLIVYHHRRRRHYQGRSSRPLSPLHWRKGKSVHLPYTHTCSSAEKRRAPSRVGFRKSRCAPSRWCHCIRTTRTRPPPSYCVYYIWPPVFTRRPDNCVRPRPRSK